MQQLGQGAVLKDKRISATVRQRLANEALEPVVLGGDCRRLSACGPPELPGVVRYAFRADFFDAVAWIESFTNRCSVTVPFGLTFRR
jgi:hypothetical protein